MNYIDVNIFIYWLGDDPSFGETATTIIERIETKEKGITSSLTPWLIHVVLEREAKEYSQKVLIEKLLSIRNLKFVPLTIAHYRNAVEFSSQYGLDLEDALHLSVALENKAKNIYSNDEDFDTTPLKRIFK
jgi:predicted nucleic acid-binding protein